MADTKTSILLTAEDRTRAAFESAKASLGGLTAGAAKLNGLLSTLGVGAIAGGGLLAFAKSSIDAADGLNDLSQKLGVNVTTLAGYKLAAEQSGTSLEAFGVAARNLARNIAQGDPLLAKLGITARDVDGAMAQLADVFAAMPDGAEKTAIAMQLMGKSGADMIPTLNAGGTELARMVEEGKRLYPVTEQMAKAADQFNDSMARLKIGAEGLGVSLANALLPALNGVVEKLTQGASMSGQFGFFHMIAQGVNPTGDVVRELKNLNEEIANTERVSKNLKPGTLFYGDTAQKLAELKAMRVAFQEIQRAQALALNDKYGTGDYKQAKTPGKDMTGILSDADASKLQSTLARAFDDKVLEDFLASFQDKSKAIQAEYAKLKASLSAGPAKENPTGLDIAQGLAMAREARMRGDSAGAGVLLDRAKGDLQTLAKNGGAGFEINYYSDQLRDFELQMNAAAEKTAQATAAALRTQMDQAKVEVSKMDPLVVPLAADAIANDLRRTIDTVRKELAANPLVVPVVAQAAGASDTRTAALKLGAR